MSKPKLTRLPLLALRDVVVYPHMQIALFVGRIPSINAVEVATEQYDGRVLVVAQKDSLNEDIDADNLYQYGTVCRIISSMPHDSDANCIKVLIEGEYRARLHRTQMLQRPSSDLLPDDSDAALDDSDVPLDSSLRLATPEEAKEAIALFLAELTKDEEDSDSPEEDLVEANKDSDDRTDTGSDTDTDAQTKVAISKSDNARAGKTTAALKSTKDTPKTKTERLGTEQHADDNKHSYLLAAFRRADIEVTLDDNQQENTMKALISLFADYAEARLRNSRELTRVAERIDNLLELMYFISTRVHMDLADKQKLLETDDISEHINLLTEFLAKQSAEQSIEQDIQEAVRRQMENNQREYFLNEKMKAIKNELSDLNDGMYDPDDDIDELEQRLVDANLPDEVRKKAEQEFKKLRMMPPASSESSVVRNYLEWILDTPWLTRSDVSINLATAQSVLDADHYGLNDVKDRILEYLAVQARVNKLKGPILCLVGPPGVGKTSLGESIARATGRQFVRMALGGVRDEAEIRGHRRTYIGAMPGKIVQSLTKVEVKNPLFLLDEIDKMAQDFRGDPASALLEVLDPSQNHAFSDHYLDLDLDLSEVMFICTANSMDIPPALLDRMEVIRLPGYTEDEKVSIAKQYLLPKAIEQNGLSDAELVVTPDALHSMVQHYTREAGVRNLEREINKICRKVVRASVTSEEASTQLEGNSDASLSATDATSNSDTSVSPKKGRKKSRKAKSAPPLVQKTVNADNLSDYLGVAPYDFGLAEEAAEIGRVTGLAWTQVGGELLTIEVVTMSGKGEFIYTGSLGDVMKESIKAAMSVVRARGEMLGIDYETFKNTDVHVHMPEGATPKDGPSAGIALTTALVSAMTGIAIRPDIAMTGEVTLRGKVLRIGGLKEKLLAAHRGGIKHVLIPTSNVRDLAEIPDNVKEGLTIQAVDNIDEVLKVALVSRLKPIKPAKVPVDTTKSKKALRS